MAAPELIRLESVTKRYGTGDASVVALNDFSMSVEVGESLAVMGPFAVGLSEQDILDLAAYYSYMPRQPGSHPDATVQWHTMGAPLLLADASEKATLTGGTVRPEVP